MTQETKQTLISALFAIGCLLLYFFYPVGDSRFEIFVATLIFLCGLPLLYNKIVLHRTVRDMGLESFLMEKKDILLLASAVVLGGLISFFLVAMNFGIQRYIGSLSLTIVKNFGAFAIYELVFSLLAMLLFSFFAWGFVRSIAWHKEIYAYFFSLCVFGVLLMDFYSGFFIIVPLIIPALFLLKMDKKINFLYIFIACYSIGLILDTIIVKSFASIL
ncbi:MAG: hypothetical protein WC819_06735 [Parcubacteria group bacterium]|jgi:hypothetical protein